MSIMRTMLRTPRFQVIDHVCGHPRVDCGYVQGDEPARFILTRRGSFAVHAGGRTWFARPGRAVLVQANVEYRISHPDPTGCDCCIDVWMSEETVDALGLGGPVRSPGQAFRHDLAFQKVHVEMLHGIEHVQANADDGDEVLLEAVDYLLEPYARKRPREDRSTAARKVARVEEAILSQGGENLSIDSLAGLAHCSPFHLCRIFRQRTGLSMRQFRLQQRVSCALARLGEGETDLAALACDVGFSSHSHMSESFRRAFGRSPAAIRDDLRRSDLRRLLTWMQARSTRRH